MKYMSTRGQSPVVGFDEAVMAGLAPDGGLYVPEKMPTVSYERLPPEASLAEVAATVIKPFIEGSRIATQTDEICRKALNFPAPLVKLDEDTSVLELFHGPTAAFKDFGARFLAECMERLGGQIKRTLIVATSGDTGGAVASAFHDRENIDVVILFPKGMVSPFQEKQLTGWGGNVRAFAVRGTFDDCQHVVKEAFLDTEWQKLRHPIGANSINIGRILPQVAYYCWASLTYFRVTKSRPSFLVPTGNLGNALAALWAKKIGFPITKVVLTCNANRPVFDFFQSGQWKPKPAVRTLANAMDVGNASNMERLMALYPNLTDLNRDAEAFTVSDDEISQTIKDEMIHKGRLWCPHTATGVFVRKKLKGSGWIIVATAHPAKFSDVIEPIAGPLGPLPQNLSKFESWKSHFVEIEPSLKSLNKALS